ncbi:MAG: Small-conductance mechanosensitive channel [Puniceicoccaceae bacterium 5H]|nr:MAG: Small-conductance mechanosensitive channel [Puniceicoccaceae bacterium 5H]
MNDLNEALVSISDWLAINGLDFLIHLLAALVIFVIGRMAASWLTTVARMQMARAKLDDTLIGFLSNILHALLLAAVVVIALDVLGVQTTSLVAILGAAGLAVALALQGSLSNFAAGVMLIIFRPFKAGDFVDAGGIMGVVEEIKVFQTYMRTGDNKQIIVPNSNIMDGNITNFSAKETRRIDFTFGVGYDDDIRKVKAVLTELVESDERILKEPAPTIGLLTLNESSVDFVVRPWVKSADYWPVYWDMMEKVKLRFDEEGITIPYPQRDIHHYNVEAKPRETGSSGAGFSQGIDPKPPQS